MNTFPSQAVKGSDSGSKDDLRWGTLVALHPGVRWFQGLVLVFSTVLVFRTVGRKKTRKNIPFLHPFMVFLRPTEFRPYTRSWISFLHPLLDLAPAPNISLGLVFLPALLSSFFCPVFEPALLPSFFAPFLGPLFCPPICLVFGPALLPPFGLRFWARSFTLLWFRFWTRSFALLFCFVQGSAFCIF